MRDEAPPIASEPDAGAFPALGLAIALGAVAVLALLVVLIDPLHHTLNAAIHGDTAELRRQIDDLGPAGPLIVLALCLMHAVLIYPTEIVSAAAGFAYGFWLGLLIVMAGWLLNALAAYAIGRSLARPLLYRLIGRERYIRAERAIGRGGVTLLITVRLVPFFPFSIVCYAMGAAEVPLGRYVWTTAVGYLPITAIAVYLGTRLEGIHLTDPLVLGPMLALLALVLFAHFLVPRGGDDEDEDTAHS